MNNKRIIIGAIALIVIITAFVWVVQRFGLGKEEKAARPVAQVQIAKVERKTITEKTDRVWKRYRAARQNAFGLGSV